MYRGKSRYRKQIERINQAFELGHQSVTLNIYSSEVKKLLKKYPFLEVSPNPSSLSKELRNKEYKYQFDISKMEEKIVVDFLDD